MNTEFGITLAFVSGILGSFHCLGMCCGVNGGFFAGFGHPPRIAHLVAFHGTRIALYSILGIGGALLGKVLVTSGIVGKTQGLLMILAGGLIVFLGLNLSGWIGRKTGPSIEPISVPFCATLPENRSFVPPLIAGLFNGLVPCSLVFSVAVKASASADPLQAGLLMLAFGAGTLPSMIALSLIGATIGYQVRGLLAQAAGVAVILLGLWTIYEGYIMYDVIRGLANW